MDNKKLEEAVEVVNNKLLPCLETMFWKGEKEHPEKTELVEATKTLLFPAQLFLSVKDAPNKKTEIDGEYSCNKCATQGYNLCHDEFTAWLVGRMGEIENCVRNSLIKLEKETSKKQIAEVDEKGLWNADLISNTFDEIIEILTTAIKTMFLEGAIEKPYD